MSAFDALLLHSYTRTAYSAGSEDAWGEAASTAGSASSGLVCFYNPADRLQTGPEGRVELSVPTLLVAAGSALADSEVLA